MIVPNWFYINLTLKQTQQT